MKKQLTLLALTFASIIMIASCTSQSAETETSHSRIIDSAKLRDSLDRIELAKADEKKVIGDIEFGITEKVFNKQSDKFRKSSFQKSDVLSPYHIGEYKFSDLNGRFDDKKLYSVTLKGRYIHYDDYKSELLHQVDFLKTMLNKKYGEPTSGDGAPPWHRTDNGYSYLAYSWGIGTKTIAIRVTDRELYYTVDLEIYQPDIEELIEKREANKSMEIADAAKDVL